VCTDAYAVYTNTSLPVLLRGFGVPTGTFMAVMQVDALAEALGHGPVEFRHADLFN
jgi:CO/xanthine dehydrogenase Mo-binding subunit